MSNGQFAISLHIMTPLSMAEEKELFGNHWLPSDFIASGININPVLGRKELSNLRNSGLVQSKEGKNGGSALPKVPTKYCFPKYSKRCIANRTGLSQEPTANAP